MLAGIEVDTNEFNIKTSPETFKTAAYLLELGANNIDKQNLLKENKENYCKRQDFIKKSYMINKNMALCVMDKNIYEIEVNEMSKIESAIINFIAYTIVVITLLSPIIIIVYIKKKKKDN